jgi:hypothetical protein
LKKTGIGKRPIKEKWDNLTNDDLAGIFELDPSFAQRGTACGNQALPHNTEAKRLSASVEALMHVAT